MSGMLSSLGVYGFDAIEPLILSALVTEDPLLLIGESGTGKTYLLNSLSEALGLEHRHYNASLVSFDDLVGFPYPDEDKATVRFLETPATVWGAESVLVDEISRCKPEHQNRLFSLIHERRVQGVALPKLRYRWAAMNPCSPDQGGDYAGSEPLDRALADRFGLIVDVVDWKDLSDEDRLRVADPAGEGQISEDDGFLAGRLFGWRQRFESLLKTPPENIVQYASTLVTALNDGGTRVSPRRARMIARTLLAWSVVEGRTASEEAFRDIAECSMPHRAYGATVTRETIAAAHRAAWDASMCSGTQRWVNEFHLARNLARKVEKLLDHCPSPDAGTMALCQALAHEDPAMAAALAFVLYPAAALGKLPIGSEAVNDLGLVAQPILRVDAEIDWREPYKASGTQHPAFDTIGPVLDRLRGARLKRARQFFYWTIAEGLALRDPESLERDIERAVSLVSRRLG
ncbi:MAG: MoxR family ATPase [Fimbriimonadaceae bacterium]|nr:MoxR family ATPase [Fimbriimonadaceae bacterium]